MSETSSVEVHHAETKAPLLIAIQRGGAITTLLLIFLIAIFEGVMESLVPGFKPFGDQIWRIVYTPAAISLVIGLIAIVLYPSYLPRRQLFRKFTRKEMRSSMLWLFGAIGFFITFGLWPANTLREALLICWLGLFVAFLCFLNLWYHPDKHPVIHSFLETTCGLGILVIPFYIPSLLLASWRYRRMQRNASDTPRP
ncbi:hypothetical protein [Rubinisphaera sp. JC750]|uniref:hypothetical protein n=1 Tax=Rubinisphaera sp. JC750 TaxID=2898658 RepID=UPI001F383F52|nr:hypothetical protein [Rubinisphaera sp. JC750]